MSQQMNNGPTDETAKNENIVLKNPHIAEMPEDILYHLSLGSGTHDLKEMFSDVKFVCAGGTPRRMESFARFIQTELNIKLPTGADLYDISRYSYRYAMFKIGPVLSISHGMGIPSVSILLHEVIKLIYHAGCKNVTFLRLGTCGGIGLPAGSLIISESAVNGDVQPYLKLHILGKHVERPAILDKELALELKSIAEKELPDYNTIIGKTMCTYDFYEEQGRLDGAFCDFTEKEKLAYLKELQRQGVANIEMESLAFAAICHHAGVRGAVICVSLLNRLEGDQVTTPKEILEQWQMRPQELAASFIKKRLNL